MRTIERRGVEARSSTGLSWRSTAFILGGALLALGIWMLFGMRPNSAYDAPPAVVELISDYTAAWNAHDAGALADLVTADYRLGRRSSGDYSLTAVRDVLMPEMDAAGWEVVTSGPLYAVQEGPRWYVSSEPTTIESGFYSDGEGVGVDVFRLVETADGLKVSHHFLYSS